MKRLDPSLAVARIQHKWRSERLRKITALVRESITCVVCGDPGESFLCQNEHPICRACLYNRCVTMRSHDCCICRDDRGYTLSPFVRQANLLGMRWVCPECLESVRMVDATEHRARCKHREVRCPVDACSMNCARRDLVMHLQQHAGKNLIRSSGNTIGLVHTGGTGDVILVWPLLDRVVHLKLAGHHDAFNVASGVWFCVHGHAFGDKVKLSISNVDPIDGRVREMSEIDMDPATGLCTDVGTSPVHARIGAFAIHRSVPDEVHTIMGCCVHPNASLRAELVRRTFLPARTMLSRPSALPITVEKIHNTVFTVCLRVEIRDW